MARFSSHPVVPNQEMIAERTTGSMPLILAAWLATLLLSKLPLVIARDMMGGDIPWITTAWISVALLLFTVSLVWHPLAPLRSFFAVMTVLFLVTTVLDPWVSGTAAWQSLIVGASPLVALFAERLLIAIEAIIVLVLLLVMGWKRRDVFLTAGDLNAPAGGVRGLIRSKPISWVTFGTVITLLLGGLFIAFMLGQNPTGLSGFTAALPWLPLVLLSAALNAFGEEAMYRAAPLATLLPAVGPKHALWMTAIWFGLGHYYGGIPSGPFGFVQSGLLGLLLGKAMLDTRGMGWPWIIHVSLDIVIYSFIAMGMR